ncbi:hypothetical protein EC844_111103 [Acinetobacter calcoaceticus]|uniref:Uncharacterized protein n=1 Tax=Acinetobacter calcoaceticus TaxID=471 RepID=A0A4R1Y418_ACICA|nr:hypothetical protein EC844_111103 [Acinetobacter calcoaceticus]
MINDPNTLTYLLVLTFGILFFVSLLLGIVSQIKPSFFVWFKLPNNRFHLLIIFICMAFIFNGLVYLFMPAGYP